MTPVDQNAEAVLSHISHQPVTKDWLCEKTGLGTKACTSALDFLIRRGIVVRGKAAGYSLPSTAGAALAELQSLFENIIRSRRAA